MWLKHGARFLRLTQKRRLKMKRRYLMHLLTAMAAFLVSCPAQQLLAHLTGREPPAEWREKLPEASKQTGLLYLFPPTSSESVRGRRERMKGRQTRPDDLDPGADRDTMRDNRAFKAQQEPAQVYQVRVTSQRRGGAYLSHLFSLPNCSVWLLPFVKLYLSSWTQITSHWVKKANESWDDS